MAAYTGFFEATAAASPQTVCTALEAEPNIALAEALGDQDETGYGIVDAATAAVNESCVHVVTIDRGTSTGGTFVLTVDGEDSAAIEYDTNAATLETDIEAITGVTAVDVEGTGTVADPWVVTFVDKGPKVISGDGANLTGGDSTLTVTDTVTGFDGVKAADTTITIDTVSGLIPIRTPFYATIEDEKVRVTAYTSTSLTVERGVLGTAAADHDDSTAITFDAEVLPQPNKVVFKTSTEDPTAKTWAGAVNDVGNLDDSQTDITYDGGSGTKATIPFVIIIDDERMEVTADSDTVFTVVRGFGGTTAATHLDNAAIATSILAADITTAGAAVTGLQAAVGYPDPA